MHSRLLLTALLAAGAFLCHPIKGSAASQDHCYLRDAAAPTDLAIYTVCEQGQFYASLDGGATWKTYQTNAPEELRAMAFLDAWRGVVVGEKGVALTTADGGKTWSRRETGTDENLTAVYAKDGELWASGYNGTILHSSDAGLTWNKQISGVNQAIESIYFLDAYRGWAVGWSATNLRTEDGGRTWLPGEAKDAMWTLSSVCFRDAKNGWAVGFSGQLLRSRDGGVTWQSEQSPGNAWLTSVTVDRSGQVWMVTDSQLYVSRNGEAPWQDVSVRDKIFLAKTFSSPDSFMVVGSLGLIRQNGAQWDRIASLAPAGMAVADPAYASTRPVIDSTETK